MSKIEPFSTMKLVSKNAPEPYLNKSSLLLITDKIERNRQATNEYLDGVKEQIEIKKLDIKADATNSRSLDDIIEPGAEELTIVNDGFPHDNGHTDPSEEPDDDKMHFWDESGSFSTMKLISK